MRRPRIFWAWTLTLTAALLAVVWVRSMKVTITMFRPQGTMSLNAGGLYFTRVTPNGRFQPDLRTHVLNHWNAHWWPARQELPLPVSGGTIVSWFIPLWPFVLLTGVPGVWMLVKTRKHTNPHECPACGYDRTGLPPTSTGPAPCPECGKGKDEDAVKG